ncbi:MAG TPA: protein translocase subunit SecDF, partial [Chitinophagaceae bacterium]|nr:protein translocase subunit SecDF [Chitinophagaceae bacterium]
MAEKAKLWTKNHNANALTKYPGDKEKQTLYQDTIDQVQNKYMRHLLDSTRDKPITWWGQSYLKAKESELLLGLDLQGGINVAMNIELTGLIKGLCNNPNDPGLKKAIDEANKRKTNSDANFIDLFAQAFKDVNPGQSLAPLFSNNTRNKLKIDASDAAVVAYLHDRSDAAMQQTTNVLTRRIDKFGVSQPNINLDKNKGIITVELAGANDPERVRKVLQSTANLQFFEVYNINELSQSLEAADKSLTTILSGTKTTDTAAKAAETAKNETPKDSSLDVLLKKDTTKKPKAVADANLQYPLIKYFNAGFVRGKDGQPAKDNSGNIIYTGNLGYVPLKDTALLNSYLTNPVVANNFPSNVKFLYGVQEKDESGKLADFVMLYAIKTIPGSDKAKLEGEHVTNARQDYDQFGKVEVSMSMDKAGATIWEQMTGDAFKKKSQIAIVLDDLVYSAPGVTNGAIAGGNSQISGNFTVEQGQDLANILEAGKLEAPARIVQEQVVGPTLGAEAVHGGMMAFAISFVVIFMLMLVYYNTAGWVANIALILNLLFTIGVLSALNATLTAPGIAGLVLTIGMAVDTNVIIFERIKEELTKGKNYPQAVKDGYRRSLPPVLDAHVTTLLTALILLYFGLGPVKGFAVTQILGILLSLFCGILVSRLITDFWTNKNRHFTYFTSVSKRVFKHAAYKFIEYRKVAYGISVIVLILGVGSFFNGFREGVEFRGGRSYVVNFYKPVNEEKLRNDLSKVFEGEEPVTKTYGSTSKLEILTDYKITLQGLAADSMVKNKLFEGLKSYLPPTATLDEFTNTVKYVEGSKKVDPTISDDLKKGAYKAMFWSLLIITVYIFIRFRDWRFSLGTIFSLLHDVLVTLAVFSFLKNVVPFPLEIDQHFIAAILTVIGFSMNDTVIVFDRVRENSRLMKGAPTGEIINKSINDTLSRTIMTSLTVFLTLLILFLVGGEVTKGFAFAMLIGVITGTYSSIFVAAPILVDFAKGKPLGEADLLAHDDKKKVIVTPAATKKVKA